MPVHASYGTVWAHRHASLEGCQTLRVNRMIWPCLGGVKMLLLLLQAPGRPCCSRLRELGRFSRNRYYLQKDGVAITGGEDQSGDGNWKWKWTWTWEKNINQLEVDVRKMKMEGYQGGVHSAGRLMGRCS
jgi:hypothetical protein